MSNYWIKALREYNKDNEEEWCIPKKGSANYAKIQLLMDSYKRTEKKTNTQNNNIESAATGSFAASKIQALVRGVQYRQKEKKEKTKKALEK